LDGTDLGNILPIECPDEAFNEFMKQSQKAFEEALPLKAVKLNKKYIKREPWFTAGLLSSSRLSNKLYKPTENNIMLFKTYNTIFSKSKRLMKINY